MAADSTDKQRYMASGRDSAKTKRPDYKPVIQQALQLCGERPSNDEALVFEGLTDASWISRPLKAWIEASGIKKHITFHCGRHSYGFAIVGEWC